MVAAWEASCGMLDQYGMQHTRTFANLCNLGVSVKQLGEAACIRELVRDVSKYTAAHYVDSSNVW